MAADGIMERAKHIGAGPYERVETRNGHANGFKPRSFHSSMGGLNLADATYYKVRIDGNVRDSESFQTTCPLTVDLRLPTQIHCLAWCTKGVPKSRCSREGLDELPG